ncbi:YhbY family RNA-binding protein [Candidatus Pacearchaeota archaeon]|nr:YhbY family RNA-binding protein [Candidatus Pacearchaeota archaeon]
MTSKVEVQLGKKGLTPEFLDGIKKRFEKASVKNIKIHVLSSARENREDIKKYAKEILNFLGKKFDCRIIGFSIFVLKLRKNRIE